MVNKILLVCATAFLITACDDDGLNSVSYKPVCKDCIKVQIDKAYQEPFNCLKDMNIKNITYVFMKDIMFDGSLVVYGNYEWAGRGEKRIKGYEYMAYDNIEIGRNNGIIDYENDDVFLTMPEKGLIVSPKDYTARLGQAVKSLCESAQEYKQKADNVKAWKKVE